MSDHGARPMMGGLCFNDWLIQEGYLTLEEPVTDGPDADQGGEDRLVADASPGATAGTTAACSST